MVETTDKRRHRHTSAICVSLSAGALLALDDLTADATLCRHGNRSEIVEKAILAYHRKHKGTK